MSKILECDSSTHYAIFFSLEIVVVLNTEYSLPLHRKINVHLLLTTRLGGHILERNVWNLDVRWIGITKKGKYIHTTFKHRT